MPVKGPSEAGDVPWLAFTAVCAAYLAVTVGESALSPLYPVVAEDLGADVESAGLALGVLTGSIAVANIGGGYLLAGRGPRPAILLALALVVAGGVVSASADALPQFIAGQVLLGLAAGGFFAPGIHAVGVLGGSRRRGLVMGIFGVAFSSGLAVAALLGALGAAVDWRASFLLVSGLGAAALVVVSLTGLPARPPAPADGVRRKLREAFGRAAAVGSAAAVSQYGTVAFFPLFAIEAWDVSAGAAALLLAAGRVLSVPAKTLAGHFSDTRGPLPTLRALGLVLLGLGALWMLAPTGVAGAVPAIAFAAAVSGAFPVANVLALDELAGRGPLLGTYRSVQMGVGALAAAAIGAGAGLVGLRPTLLATLVAPAALVLVASRWPARRPIGVTASEGTAQIS